MLLVAAVDIAHNLKPEPEAAIQRAWVASALAGAAASHFSAHAERANAPSPSRFWTVAQFVQIRVISTAFKAYAFIPRLPLAREDAERTGACRVYRHQDGERLIRIADRGRCKPITPSTWHAHARVSMCMSQCKDDAQERAVVRMMAATARS